MIDCKRRPRLRFLYYTDNSLIIGSTCKNKVEGVITKTRHRRKTKINKHEKLRTPSLLDIYGKKPQDYGVTPHSVWIEDKQRNEEEYL